VQKILEMGVSCFRGLLGNLWIFGGLQIGSISLCGSSVRGAPFWGFGRIWEDGSGDGHHPMGVH